MHPSSPITVAITDDNFIFLEGLYRSLSQCREFEVVLKTEDCHQLIQELRSLSRAPDICIMDIAMPDGYATLKLLKDEWPRTRVLILSATDNELSVIRTIKIGANGFLMKGSDPDTLRQTLLDIFSNDRPDDFANQRRHTSRDHVLVQLSYTELELLYQMCTEKNSNQIAADMQTSLKSFERSRNELFRKLKVNSRIGLVLFALNMGMVSSDTPKNR